MSLRRLFGLLLLTPSFQFQSLLAQTGTWRPPVPAGCPSPVFEAILIDVSRSMVRRGLFNEVQRSAAEHIRHAVPACTLEIVASFGLTADVSDAAFVMDAAAREKLVRGVMALKPEHHATNMDEAAKLVELLSYELHASYGNAADRLVVRVYSDFESSPSAGKPQVSLGAYLSQRMGARYLRAPGAESAGNQIFDLTVGAGPSNTEVPPPEKAHDRPYIVIAVAATATLVIALLALLLKFRAPRSARLGDGPSALLVTERTVDDGGASGASPERRIEVAPGVPAVFSTDRNSATYIASEIPGGVNGELFRMEPLADGSIRIESPHPRLTVNDEPLNLDRRLNIDVHEPVRVRLGSREFNVIGVFSRPRPFDRTSDVFEADALGN